MSLPLWVSEAAAAFWQGAGGPEPFPRDLRGPLLRCRFDLTIAELRGLTVRAVERYLAGLDVAWGCGTADRRLHACLAADGGSGFIFLDAGDGADERRFSLAHELAHFLRDYWQPRRRAAAALGESALDVLDARRAARTGEQLHGLLRGVRAGPYVHLMARDGRTVPAAVAAAERDADRLACELLAPADEVCARLPPRAGAAEAEAVLRRGFGLPAGAAAEYAALLLPSAPPPGPLLARLEKALAARRTSGRAAEPLSGGTHDEQRP
jgi:hypothetical protein